MLAALAIAPSAHALTYTVVNLNDSGPGSLRQAVLDANANAGTDDIQFSVNGTIALTSGELVVTESLFINGPGARRLTLAAGPNARVLRLDNVAAKDVVVNDVTITGGNVTGNGGCILNQGGNLSLNGVRLVGNVASGEGGGIYNQYFAAGNILTINYGEISANRANKNAGIYFIGYELRIVDSTIHGNIATDNVGAILVQSGYAVVRNSTITGNSATFVGGIQTQDSPTFTLGSTIVAGNTDSTGLNDINRIGSGTVNASYSLFQEDITIAPGVINGTDTGNLIGVDPLLGPLQNNGGSTDSRRPAFTSPAIGVGSNPLALSRDQRGVGFPRDAGGAVDIGAIQAYVPPPPVATPVPALAPVALALLSLLLGAIGRRSRRR